MMQSPGLKQGKSFFQLHSVPGVHFIFQQGSHTCLCWPLFCFSPGESTVFMLSPCSDMILHSDFLQAALF